MRMKRYGQDIVAKVSGRENQPVSLIQWVDRNQLHANAYNPNTVPPPELDLLEISILEDGWTQPIVARTDGEIVDGFHRWTVSSRPKVFAMTEGFVPVVLLVRDMQSQMMSTIRHNRARGIHGVKPMSQIIVQLVTVHNLTKEEICGKLGMEMEEVNRLFDRTGIVKHYANAEFHRAWTPSKNGIQGEEFGAQIVIGVDGKKVG